jgi:hypothetical protein
MMTEPSISPNATQAGKIETAILIIRDQRGIIDADLAAL